MRERQTLAGWCVFGDSPLPDYVLRPSVKSVGQFWQLCIVAVNIRLGSFSSSLETELRNGVINLMADIGGFVLFLVNSAADN